MYLFVYYKFDSTLSEQVHSRAQQLQSGLAAEFTLLDKALLKRPTTDDQPLTTWMESYQIHARDESRFQGRLQELATTLDLPQPRHTEVFVSVSALESDAGT
jgi:hypothetical protein